MGSLADWVGVTLTFIVFVWGIYQFRKQTELSRAFEIEKQRPRFFYERTTRISKGDRVLRPNYFEESTPQNIKERLKQKDEYFFRINNISQNGIYSLKIIFSHDNQVERYRIHGVSKNSAMVLVPKSDFKNWESLFIKFRSSANEIGYMYASEGNTTYYFVKGRNRMITTSGDDRIIANDEKLVQKFDRKFKSGKSSSAYFYAEENMNK
ncbi:hypothetical protein FP435_01040 [Lactobacillus sp. PV037]|uniref:hypothetical protein n=1 Tax=Lactobacillus sp. PV037 TaxID=2594496 RepID=UPI00223EC8AC|nr:hypothetical protein [Lactobacillus sp. PV037]QNQ83123.1 hypothetical protein FP435_01040 [Lactobacillus sp. PV037]